MNVYFVDCGQVEILDDVIITDWCAPRIEITHLGWVFGVVAAETRGQARATFIDHIADDDGIYLSFMDRMSILTVAKDVDLPRAAYVDWDALGVSVCEAVCALADERIPLPMVQAATDDPEATR